MACWNKSILQGLINQNESTKFRRYRNNLRVHGHWYYRTILQCDVTWAYTFSCSVWMLQFTCTHHRCEFFPDMCANGTWSSCHLKICNTAMSKYFCMHGTLNLQLSMITITYGSLFLGKRVPNSLIRSLILKRRRLSTERNEYYH
jgi:hypothetical protein